ncbi:MAG: TIGR04076 family protein [Victivallales bacterium]|nr:TIGR04076 family protein [Victivallales bacterium]
MLDVRITAIRKTEYPDLMEQYEKPLPNPCSIREGQVFLVHDGQQPDGFCDSAWQTLKPFILELANGGGHFYGDWMKNPHSALLSCNDGFRPVSFLLETIP